MIDLLAQFPIENLNATIKDLHAEAFSATRMMAYEKGYTVVGQPSYQVHDFAAGMFLDCRVAVEPRTCGGGTFER